MKKNNKAKKDLLKKELINSRLLSNYGSWMYCGECNNTVGYLCFSTYSSFKFNYKCNCGNEGSFELQFDEVTPNGNTLPLITKKNRLCCPFDESPLFSVVNKNVVSYSYDVVCSSCLNNFKIEMTDS